MSLAASNPGAPWQSVSRSENTVAHEGHILIDMHHRRVSYNGTSHQVWTEGFPLASRAIEEGLAMKG